MPDESGETIKSTADEVAEDDAALLASYLATRDVSCPACKYNLRGCKADKCPECGAILGLRLWPTDLKLGAWITAILALAIPFEFVLVITCIVPFTMTDESDDLTSLLVLGLFFALTSALGVVLFRIIFRPNGFLKMPMNRQWLVAGIILFMLLTCVGSMAIGLIVAS